MCKKGGDTDRALLTNLWVCSPEGVYNSNLVENFLFLIKNTVAKLRRGLVGITTSFVIFHGVVPHPVVDLPRYFFLGATQIPGGNSTTKYALNISQHLTTIVDGMR